jgi:hypothetical protein
MTWGLWLYFPSKGWCAGEFYHQKSIILAKFGPKHTNRYIAKETDFHGSLCVVELGSDIVLALVQTWMVYPLP